jgi:CRP-like cAMP-binding protein
VTLLVIPANRLDAMVRTNPALALAIIKDLVGRMMAAEDRARDAEERRREAEERERKRKADEGGTSA